MTESPQVSEDNAAIHSSATTEFLFRDVNVHIKGMQILHNLSGVVNSGEVLAILGASGSGKTTLMNSLIGRTPITSGEITLDGQLLTKRSRKRMCYVEQQDIFMSKLTLWETVYFAAMVFISENVAREEKLARIDNIIHLLDLNKCRNTVVGDQFVPGLSGGEKKRLSIACQLIKDPDVMLMDELTSGLDSSTAYSLMLLMERYAKQSEKAVVISIHQPSSQVFHLFTHLLLLANGHVAYFGDSKKVLSFFEELQLVCEPHYNPADFILENVKKEQVKMIIQLAEQKRSTDLWPVKLRRTLERKMSYLSILGQGNVSASTPQAVSCTSVTTLDERKASSTSQIYFIDVERKPASSATHESPSPWATGFWMQFKMLNWRTFKQSRSRIISRYTLLQQMTFTLVCGILWFQKERTHDTVKDRVSLLFSISVHWCFMSFFSAVTSSDRPVVSRERAAGAYRLSAYFLAKMSSELPLMLVLPSGFITVVYWMAGLRGILYFFSTWGILLLHVINCQGLGFAIGAAIWDIQMSSTTVMIVAVFGVLTGGFFIDKMPVWFRWSRYFSLMFYTYNAFGVLELGDLPPLHCENSTLAELAVCANRGNNTEIAPQVILRDYGIQLPIYCSVSSIVFQICLGRILAYLALKYKNKLQCSVCSCKG